MNWRPKVLDRMAKKAFEKGFTHAETTGQLKRYISELWDDYKTANNPRIYGEDIYFFADSRLITLYRLPNELIKHTKNCRRNILE